MTGNNKKPEEEVSNKLSVDSHRVSDRTNKSCEPLLQSIHIWKEAFDNITDMITIHDRDFNIVHANRAAEEILGLPFLKGPKSKCYRFYHGQEKPPEGCPSCACLTTEEPVVFEIYEPHLNKYIEIRAMPQFDSNNHMIGLIHIVRDISERKKMEDEIKKAKNDLETRVEKRTAEAIQAKHLASIGELAAGVAHEINNPINNIINYAQILLDENGDKEIPGRIIRDADRISIIVRSLLSFSRIRKEKKTPSSFYEIFSDTLSLSMAQMRKDGIHLEVDIPTELPEVIVHPQEIQQVFLNIISNARFALNKKYPESDKEKILEILCEVITADNLPYVEISFRDKGAGIPADILDKVMDPFFSTKPAGMGTGLGLSICHRIINEHNGKLVIESVREKFTKVTISLPVSKVLDESSKGNSH